MRTGKITKTEWFLLALTAVFLCALTGVYIRDMAAAETQQVQTELRVSQESFMPEWEPLDLNKAGVEELTRLPGIGEELAHRIVEYRTARGSFETVEEIMEIPGIGKGKFAEFQDQVTVGSEGTE